MSSLLKRRRSAFAAALAFAIMCGVWAMASPIGSSPDDDFHLASIWCAHGFEMGQCEKSQWNPGEVFVPEVVAEAGSCFAFKKHLPGKCSLKYSETQLSPTERVNSNEYPGLYYRFAGLLVSSNAHLSVMLIRFANVLLAALLLVICLVSLPLGPRRAYALAICVCFVPLGIFIIASVNPSSWTISGAAALWVLLYAHLSGSLPVDRRHHWFAMAGLAVATLMAVGARADGAAYAIIIVGVTCLISARTRKPNESAAGYYIGYWGLPVAICLVSLLSLSMSRQTAAVGGMQPVAGMRPVLDAERGGVGLLAGNLLEIPWLVVGSLGGWRLGWLDTPMPSIVWVFTLLCLGFLLISGLAWVSRRKGFALALLVIAIATIPLWILQAGGNVVGEMVQPRYLLPLLVVLVGVLLLGPSPMKPIALSNTQGWLICGLVSLGLIASFWFNGRRYATGLTGRELFPDALHTLNTTGLVSLVDPPWVTPAALIPLFLIACLATVAYNISLLRSVNLLVRK